MTTLFHSDTQRRISPARAPFDGVNDGELLDQFIADQDGSAFAELVRRHSAMVLGVCQRVLHNKHDAEDCFQAAFLVLVRKAETIQPREMVGNWLYGVAYRTALEARKLSARRRDMERKKSMQPISDANHESWQELRPVFDQELSRLPDKYRAVLIACDIEGKTRHEAAAALGLPEGTIASRLARARALLVKRLAKYSLSMNTTALVAVLANDSARAHVPASLLESTILAGTRLASGQTADGLVPSRVHALADAVVRGRTGSRSKIAAAVLLVLVALGVGISALIPPAQAQRKPDPDAQKQALDPKKVKPEQVTDCVLHHIDLANGTMRATRSRFSSAEGLAYYDVQVNPETIVIIDGREGKLTDLKAGDAVDLTIQRPADGPARAVRIQTTGIELDGVVQAMTESSVTIRTENRAKDQAEDTVCELPDDGWILVNGKKTKVSDLKPRMKVAVKWATGKPNGVKIQALGPKVGGVVKKVDPDKQTLTMQIDDTHMIADAITVAADAVVLVEGRASKLADLRPGMQVSVQMSAEPDQSFILAITTPIERRPRGNR